MDGTRRWRLLRVSEDIAPQSSSSAVSHDHSEGGGGRGPPDSLLAYADAAAEPQ
jgi:hypothetical protein